MALDTKSKEEADKWGEKTVPMAPSIWNFKYGQSFADLDRQLFEFLYMAKRPLPQQ